MGKRGRSVVDITDSLNEFFSYECPSDIHPSSSFLSGSSDNEDSQDVITSSNNRGAMRVRVSPRVSAETIESQKSTGSAFATEMSFFCREEEDNADMILYLARGVSTARTPDALIALANHLSKKDPEVVMLSLKRAGLQPQLFSLLCMTPIQNITVEHQRLFLRLIAFLVPLSDAAALCDATLVKFLLLNCQPKPKNSGGTPVVPSAAAVVKQPAHWSQRVFRKAMVASPQQPPPGPNLSHARVVFDELCGVDVERSTISIALQTLLDIVFRQNSSVALPGETNVCLAFAEHNGFDIASRLLCGCECADSLHLLEAVTLCEDLRKTYVSDLHQTALCLVNFVTEGCEKQRPTEINAALRVLTNVTGLVPSVLSGRLRESSALAVGVARTLTDAEVSPDTLAFTLCLATNIVKWEVRENLTEFTSRLVEDPSFLSRTASLTLDAYHADETEKNVMAGYYALFLAVLSLCATPSLHLRVPVMTAVAHAAEETGIGKKVETKPLTLIAAILQEFLLFQSSVGSLTKESFISMNEIIDNVAKSNDIEITSDG